MLHYVFFMNVTLCLKMSQNVSFFGRGRFCAAKLFPADLAEALCIVADLADILMRGDSMLKSNNAIAISLLKLIAYPQGIPPVGRNERLR